MSLLFILTCSEDYFPLQVDNIVFKNINLCKIEQLTHHLGISKNILL